MATGSHAVGLSAGRPRAELVLAALALVSLALIPVHIKTIYSGLPAHPLFLHLPVILIPVATIWTLVLVARPRWFVSSGVLLGIVSVIALAATFLTVGAGEALRNALHLNGAFGPAALIARHAHAALILRDLTIAFTAALILAVFAHRVAGGRGTGRLGLDRVLSQRSALGSLRVLAGGLAIACAYFVFHTGDLGARAVWQGRLSGGGSTLPGARGFSPPGSRTSGSGGTAPNLPGGTSTQP